MTSTKKTSTLKESARAKASLAIDPKPPVAFDQSAIDGGRKPLIQRREDGVSAPSIEGKFKFEAQESDAEFNYLQVQSLLEQASALLDRCDAERNKHTLLQIEQLKLQTELDQVNRREQVEQQEREAGRDTLAYKRAMLECAAEKATEEYQRDSEAQLRQLLEELIASGFNKRMSAREASAWLASYPLKDHDLSGDDATYFFDGVKKTKPDHLYDAARLEADEEAWEQVYNLTAQRHKAMAAAEAAKFRKESLNLMAAWCKADIGFRTERAQIAKDSAWNLTQVQNSLGLRIAASERRFAVDFREALARLIAARRGLKELFDYAPPFPEERTAGYFEQIVIWTRVAANRLSQIAQGDQHYTLVLSIKELAKSQWEAGRSSAEWTFDVPMERFKGQAHVRLRGLGLAVVGQKQEDPGLAGKKPSGKKPDGAPPEAQKPEGFWSAQVSPPTTATVRLPEGKVREFDQKAIAACYLGRVANRDAGQEPEISGTNILHNASPIGKNWRLALSPQSTDGTPSTALQDVQLYLRVAVRGMK